MDLHTSLITVAVFIVAALYASVGHGGASGYLAVLSLFSFLPAQMALTALILNTAVSAIALFNFARGGHFTWRWIWPCIAVSIPMAWLGGKLPVSDPLYYGLLAPILLLAAWQLWKVSVSSIQQATQHEETQPPNLPILLLSSGVLGFISGIIGIGGGIFLSPLLILTRWATPKQTAAASACFILVNSIAGLFARAMADGLVLTNLWPLIIAGITGGMLGSYIGSHKLSPHWLRKLLAFVLVLAALKMLLKLFS